MLKDDKYSWSQLFYTNSTVKIASTRFLKINFATIWIRKKIYDLAYLIFLTLKIYHVYVFNVENLCQKLRNVVREKEQNVSTSKTGELQSFPQVYISFYSDFVIFLCLKTV